MDAIKTQNQKNDLLKKRLVSHKIRNIVVDVISCSFVLLFIYTAYSKIITFDSFSGAFLNSSFIGGYSTTLAGFIIGAEILTSLLLIWPVTNRLGFLAALTLMTLFTAYLGVSLTLGSKLPCGCGGIINTMSWQQHLWLNMIFLVLAISGLVLSKK